MRRRRWSDNRRTCRVRLVLLLVALGGLLAMHGLSDHGSGGHPAMTEVGDRMAADASSMAMSAGTVANVTPTAHAAASAADVVVATDSAGRGLDEMGMAGGCLAFLTGLLVHLLLVRRSWPAAGFFGTTGLRERIPVFRRDPDPPGRFVLSVQRC